MIALRTRTAYGGNELLFFFSFFILFFFSSTLNGTINCSRCSFPDAVYAQRINNIMPCTRYYIIIRVYLQNNKRYRSWSIRPIRGFTRTYGETLRNDQYRSGWKNVPSPGIYEDERHCGSRVYTLNPWAERDGSLPICGRNSRIVSCDGLMHISTERSEFTVTLEFSDKSICNISSLAYYYRTMSAVPVWQADN